MCVQVRESVCFCVYVHVYVYMYVYVCASSHVTCRWRLEDNLGCGFSGVIHLDFVGRISHWPAVHQMR